MIIVEEFSPNESRQVNIQWRLSNVEATKEVIINLQMIQLNQ